jgi:hypothetical protein
MSDNNKTSLALTKYKTNPFLDDFEVVTSNKQVRISGGDNNNLMLQNIENGERQATHVISYRKVDKELFIKLYTQNCAALFGLTSTGTKSFTFLLWLMQMGHNIRKDQVYIDPDEDRLLFIEWEFKTRKNIFIRNYHEVNFIRFNDQKMTLEEQAKEIETAWDNRKEKPINFSKTTFLRGLSNLADNQICVKSVKTNIYFTNPNIVFNGDRVAFSTVLEKQKEEQENQIVNYLENKNK